MYEGLIVRINGFMRKIHLIVIHCSATRADKELTAFDLDTMHRRRGFNGTGYHYYIRKDGTTHLTRPVERIGAHAKGFNAESIGICYEGGLDIRSTPADTRTPAQRASLVALLRELKRIFPKILVVGHHDLNPMKECPCFNAVAEYGGLSKLK
mgnify:FL=1